MSIDARIEAVVTREDGSGELRLTDRPARPGENPGVAGQCVLRFDRAPPADVALAGLDVWGGDASLMLGEAEIARRLGYTRIEFHDDATLKGAVAAYHGGRPAHPR